MHVFALFTQATADDLLTWEPLEVKLMEGESLEWRRISWKGEARGGAGGGWQQGFWRSSGEEGRLQVGGGHFQGDESFRFKVSLSNQEENGALLQAIV